MDPAAPSQSQARTADATGEVLGRTSLLEIIYRFKQKLCYLLLKKHRTRKQCAKLIPRLMCRDPATPGVPASAVGTVGRDAAQLVGGDCAHVDYKKDFTPKWRCCNGRLTDSAISPTTGYGCAPCARDKQGVNASGLYQCACWSAHRARCQSRNVFIHSFSTLLGSGKGAQSPVN
jgi:hypothetical protein